MACAALEYPAGLDNPVPWVTLDDCEIAEDFIGQATDAATGYANAARARALAFINSVDDGRIIVTPDPIPIWPPL
jgi:hypothetical protein